MATNDDGVGSVCEALQSAITSAMPAAGADGRGASQPAPDIVRESECLTGKSSPEYTALASVRDELEQSKREAQRCQHECEQEAYLHMEESSRVKELEKQVVELSQQNVALDNEFTMANRCFSFLCAERDETVEAARAPLLCELAVEKCVSEQLEEKLRKLEETEAGALKLAELRCDKQEQGELRRQLASEFVTAAGANRGVRPGKPKPVPRGSVKSSFVLQRDGGGHNEEEAIRIKRFKLGPPVSKFQLPRRQCDALSSSSKTAPRSCPPVAKSTFLRPTVKPPPAA